MESRFATPRAKTPVFPALLGALALLTAMAGVGYGVWQGEEARRENLRLSTELAQLRVSMELFARDRPQTNAVDDSAVAELEDRIAALESATQLPAIPATEPAVSAPAVTSSGEDCLPPGMRLLVAMGDEYAVCGQPATIDVGMVDNGYITLGDGTTVPSGGSMPLPNSSCTIAVTSSGDEGLTGYAEIRVSC